MKYVWGAYIEVSHIGRVGEYSSQKGLAGPVTWRGQDIPPAQPSAGARASLAFNWFIGSFWMAPTRDMCWMVQVEKKTLGNKDG